MKTRSSSKKLAETEKKAEVRVSRNPQKRKAVRKTEGALITKSKKKIKKKKAEKKKLPQQAAKAKKR